MINIKMHLKVERFSFACNSDPGEIFILDTGASVILII